MTFFAGAYNSMTRESSLTRTYSVKITQCVDHTRDVGNGRNIPKIARAWIPRAD